jgi:lysophospholipase L1-like esterase
MMYTYLALGDSYTIGESVPLFDAYPYQAVQYIRNAGKALNAPEIIAKTGWSTSDLTKQLDSLLLAPHYDFVSILIGVNNQYRGLPPSQYSIEFENLLKLCIAKAKDNFNRVFVLSIPDWALTPFARGRDITTISSQIAVFNSINSSISKTFNVNYIDITTGSPETFNDSSFLSADALHPSTKAYKRWAKLLGEKMLETI